MYFDSGVIENMDNYQANGSLWAIPKVRILYGTDSLYETENIVKVGSE